MISKTFRAKKCHVFWQLFLQKKILIKKIKKLCIYTNHNTKIKKSIKKETTKTVKINVEKIQSEKTFKFLYFI